MAQRWSGSIHLEAGWALFAGGVGDNAAHRHQALQIAVAGSDGVNAEVEGRAIAGRWLAIAPRARHRVWCGGPLAFLLYLDPLSDAGRAVAARLGPHPVLAGRELPAGPLAAAEPRPPASWDEADLQVSFTLGGQERQDVEYWGGWGWYGPGEVETENYVQGSLVIDMADRAMKRLVWHGSGTENLFTQTPNEEMVARAVDAVLAKFPPASGKTASAEQKMPESPKMKADE